MPLHHLQQLYTPLNPGAAASHHPAPPPSRNFHNQHSALLDGFCKFEGYRQGSLPYTRQAHRNTQRAGPAGRTRRVVLAVTETESDWTTTIRARPISQQESPLRPDKPNCVLPIKVAEIASVPFPSFGNPAENLFPRRAIVGGQGAHHGQRRRRRRVRLLLLRRRGGRVGDAAAAGAPRGLLGEFSGGVLI
jgi:hypothetical protein